MRMTKTIFNELCNDYAYLYVVRLYNDKESFYKVGITSKEDCTSRFKSFPYEYDIIKMYKHKDSGFIMDLESKLLSLEESYKPTKEFGGWSECITNVAKTLEFVETLSWIKGLTEHFKTQSNLNRNCFKTITGSNDYSKIADTYVKTKIRLSEDKSLEDPRNLEAKEGLETFVLSVETDSHYESLLEYIQIFGIKDLSEHSYRADKINKRLNDHKLLAELPQILKREMSLKLNSIHTKKDLKDKLQEIYDNNGISSKATAAKIKILYLVKDAKNSDGENCFKIIKKL